MNREEQRALANTRQLKRELAMRLERIHIDTCIDSEGLEQLGCICKSVEAMERRYPARHRPRHHQSAAGPRTHTAKVIELAKYLGVAHGQANDLA
jgi:hypothetical protein